MNSETWLLLGIAVVAVAVNLAVIRWAFKGKPDGTP